jgi:membrane protein required for colicin V production
VRYAAAFVLIFVAAVFAAGLLAVLIKKLVEAIGLRPADRTLGAAFGVVRGVILLLAVTVVINMTAFKSAPWWQESHGAGVSTAALKGLQPLLPEQFAKYL